MDLAKYRVVFLEEATEHLAEMSRSLLELEKDPENGEAIDLALRMAHSIKGMAASLDYASITELAHRLEDRMQASRADGRVRSSEIGLLFRGLEALEGMVATVRERSEAPPADPELVTALAHPAAAPAPAAARKKKLPTRAG